MDMFRRIRFPLSNVTCAVRVGERVRAFIRSVLPPWSSWQLLLPRSPQQLNAGPYLPRMPCWLGVVDQSNWACSSLPVAHYCLTKSLPPLCFPFHTVALISLFSPWTVQSQITQTTTEWNFTGHKITFPHQQMFLIWSPRQNFFATLLFPPQQLTADHLANVNVSGKQVGPFILQVLG